jgi:hypothetical protein
MENATTHEGPLTADQNPNASQGGAWVSIIGLVAWLVAMALAVAGPLLNIDIPAIVVVGIVIFSGLFSLLSLPRLLQSSKNDEEK